MEIMQQLSVGDPRQPTLGAMKGLRNTTALAQHCQLPVIDSGVPGISL